MLTSNLWRDLRYGARQLRRTPAFTLVAVLSLGIGTGANITVFGFVSALMFTQLPAEEPDQVIRVMGEGGNTTLAGATQSDAHIRAQDYFRYKEQNQAFSMLAAHFIGGPMRVRTEGPARVIPVMLVSANYFETLGVPAAMGRVLTSRDGKPGAGDVVVLSHVGWRRFFDADPGIVGKIAFINARPATFVGVAPAWFTGTNAPMVPQIYGPMIEAPTTTYRVDLIGRLKPGVSASQAAADLSRIAQQLTAEDRQRRGIEIYPASVLGAGMLRGIAAVAALFAIIVGVVLLIACDNIAILLLTRAARRRQEIGIRLALGAGRGQLLVQLLSESFLLCAGAGIVGLSIAHATAKFLTQFYAPVPMPFALTYDLDYANYVAPAFFHTLAVPLLAGRDFTADDDATASAVAIVNETLAQRFWPGENAVGKRLQTADGSFIDVVGLARESKYESLQEEPKAFMYRPLDQAVVPAPTFLIKATGNPAALFSLLRARVSELDPDLAAYNVMTLDDRIGLGTIATRAAATVSGGMGLLALVLSAMGIYGTMAFLVQQRRREIGVRMALGASRWNVMSLIAGRGMTWTAIGLAAGTIAGLVAALLLRRGVHGVVIADPVAFVVPPLVLGAAAYLACYLPARRAARLDPLDALREE